MTAELLESRMRTAADRARATETVIRVARRFGGPATALPELSGSTRGEAMTRIMQIERGLLIALAAAMLRHCSGPPGAAVLVSAHSAAAAAHTTYEATLHASTRTEIGAMS